MHFFLGDAIFWVAVACCTVAEVAIVRSALLAHAGPRTEAGAPVAAAPRRWTELAWTLLPALALAFVLALTWRAVRDARLDTHDDVQAVHPSGVVS